ncbi:MAG: hypothetical protein ACW964_17170, partial [Candidatus Hodarchaeales archaeon]
PKESYQILLQTTLDVISQVNLSLASLSKLLEVEILRTNRTNENVIIPQRMNPQRITCFPSFIQTTFPLF